MTTLEIANEVKRLCLEEKAIEAINTFYSKDIVSVEPEVHLLEHRRN